MTTVELLPFITGSAGALVVLFLWNLDLRQQRNYERARNSELVDRFAVATTQGNDAIRDLTDAVVDAVDLVAQQANVTFKRPRRRTASGAH